MNQAVSKDDDWVDLGETYLAEHGITDEDRDKLSVMVLDPTTLASKLGFPTRRGGVLIPYPGTDYFRVRMLGQVNGHKYLSQRDSGCSPPYLSNLLNHPKSWSEILADPSEPIIITEGELKGDIGCKSGVPTLALGGVEMQKTLQTSGIIWKGRAVALCFDHDAGLRRGEYKPGVHTALGKLASTMTKLGAEVQVIHLGMIPSLDPARKWGLDDVLLAGVSWVNILATRAEPPEWCEELGELRYGPAT